MRGTLNSSNADSVHTLIFTAILYTLYNIAILKHLEALIFKNYIRVVALTPNLRRASFRSLAHFLPNSTTVKVLQLLILIKRSYQSLRTLTCFPGRRDARRHETNHRQSHFMLCFIS